MNDLPTPPLNPAQQQVQDTLGATSEQRPTFDPSLRNNLREELENGLVDVLNGEVELPIFLSKHGLNQLHGCEAKYLAEEKVEFAWTVPLARGTVAHKAIELHIGRRDTATPLDEVEDAISRLEAEQRSISTYLLELGEGDRAQLVADANEVVATFHETFPPIKRRWTPVCESKLRADLCDGHITLSGKADMTLGQAKGTTAGKVLIDLKTGGPHYSHIEDLRFYALLETLKIGVPPRLTVNYYLESGTPHCEPVTEDILESTVRRIVDGVRKYVELKQTDPRSPAITPGQGCRWCPLRDTCEPGQHYLNPDEDSGY